ncbi:MAG: hypothetical protein IPM57_12195 [Oligoflexia bacterium]|nr:hypothetical protein [Oligoflexia bacterium]
MERKYKIVLAGILLLAITSAYMNCSDVKLSRGQQPSTTVVVPPPPPPPNPPITDPVSNLITGSTSMGQGFPDGAGTGIHATLTSYTLSSKPDSCPDNYRIIKGWQNSPYQVTTEAGPIIVTPEYVDLSDPNLINVPLPISPGQLLFQHEIRFERPPGASIYAFRIKTPPNNFTMSVSVTSQYEGMLTFTLLGCDVFSSCVQTPITNYLSVSRLPCDMSPSQTSCKFDSLGMRSFQVSENANEQNCELKSDTYYYININYAWPQINPGQCDGNNCRSVLRIVGS